MSYECRTLAEYYFMSQFEHYLLFLGIGLIIGYVVGRFQYLLTEIYRRK